MSDLNAVFPSGSLGDYSSGTPSLSTLQNDLTGMSNGTFTGLPDGSSTTSLGSFSGILSGLSASLTGTSAGTQSGVDTSGTPATTTTSGSSSNSSSLTSFTSDSLIGRVLFFVLGLIFVGGAIYSYKR